MRPLSPRVAALAGLVVLALCAGAPPALGDLTGSSLTAPASAAAGQPFPLQARLVPPGGVPLRAGVPVLFAQTSGPAGDCVTRFDPQFTVTDETGTATAQGTLPPGCPGQFVLEATAAGAGSASTTLTETGGFPDTTTDADGPFHAGCDVIGVECYRVGNSTPRQRHARP